MSLKTHWCGYKTLKNGKHVTFTTLCKRHQLNRKFAWIGVQA